MLKSKMDCKYLFAILFLSRLFISFTYIGSNWSEVRMGDKPWVIVAWFVLCLVCMLPTVFYLKSGIQNSVIVEARGFSPALAGILAIFYAFTYFLLCFDSGMRFELFASSVMFPDTPMFLFLLIIFAAAGYGAYKGFQAIGRTAVLIAALVGFAVLFLAAALLKEIDFDNLTPPFYDGVPIVLKSSLNSLGMTAELSVLPIMLSEVKGKYIKNFFIWIGILFASVLLLVFLTSSVLGEFGNSRLFPIYSVTVRASFGAFQRLDALQTGIWTLCVLIKLCFFMSLIYTCIEQGFQIKKKGLFLVCLIAVLLISVTLLSARVQSVLAVFGNGVYMATFILATVVIPLALPIAKKIKNGRSVKNTGNGVAR